MTKSMRLRGALLGFGFIAEKGHLPAYLARAQDRGDVAIEAVADVCAARRAAASGYLPHARIYADAFELLEREAGLDFVDIATPPCDHAELALRALAAGCHVLCEKPLATTAEDAQCMLAAAAAAGRVLFPCHNYKHAPVVRAIRQELASGRLGEPRTVHLQTLRTGHARGVPEWRPHWRRERRLAGGGIAMDHGSHSFYLAFEWLGAYPTTVRATMANRAAEVPDRATSAPWDGEDQFQCTLTFPHGRLALANLTWTAQVRRVVYAIHGSDGTIQVTDDDLEIVTPVATWRRNGAATGRSRVIERRTISSHWMDASHVSWFGSLFGQFEAAIVAGEWVGKEAVDALRCVEVIQTAYASARSGSVELPVGNGVAGSVDPGPAVASEVRL